MILIVHLRHLPEADGHCCLFFFELSSWKPLKSSRDGRLTPSPCNRRANGTAFKTHICACRRSWQKKPRGKARRMASEAETKKTTTISVDKTEKTDRQTDGEGRRPAKQKYHKNSHTANMVLVGMQNVNNTLLCYLPINGDDDQGAIIGFHVHFRHRRVIAAHTHTHTHTHTH
jgi:hypothetical protein